MDLKILVDPNLGEEIRIERKFWWDLDLEDWISFGYGTKMIWNKSGLNCVVGFEEKAEI